MKDPNDFTERTKTLALKRAGYVCSFPNCSKPLVGAHTDVEKVVTISEVSHICGARKASNNRFDPDMSPEQRSHVSNAIALCRTHGKLIDSDESKYTVAKLHYWKELHENEITAKQSGEYLEEEKGKLWIDCSLEELKEDRDYRIKIRGVETKKRYKRLGTVAIVPAMVAVVCAVCIWGFDYVNLYSGVGLAGSLFFLYLLFGALDNETSFESRQTSAIRELDLLIQEIEYAEKI
ncbi:hypothetical protein CGK41_09735 [Vibrio parahaemolyticus]|nr:hypothetical protein CGK41_09735 [Vibrio parahaemolyticus]